MRKLEEFIQDNRDDFDSMLPSPELWGKIESKLEKNNSGRPIIWKLSAAVAAVLVLALVGTYMFAPRTTTYRKYASVSDPEMKNLLETEAFYAEKVSSKINEIEKCYKVYPELKVDIENDLNELDNMYKDLENDLNDNLYNREVIEAMIQNNRLRLEMVDRVLNQINC
jgi:predicted transcriptional regulator